MANECKEKQHFLKWDIRQLREYLSDRNIPVTTCKKHELIEKVSLAVKLGLPVYQTEIEEDIENVNAVKAKLSLENGIINLTHQLKLKSWDCSPKQYPDITEGQINKYFTKCMYKIVVLTGYMSKFGKTSIRFHTLYSQVKMFYLQLCAL